MFIGREKELRTLNERYYSGRKEFGVVYGRRRIGKTALLGEFAKGKSCVFFQAKRDSAYGNLRSFSYVLDKVLGLPLNYVFSSYEEAFDSLRERAKGERLLLIIDEYPYVLEQEPSFSSTIQELYDHSDDNLFLILSGSDVSFLKEEIENHDSPLYKRRTFEMRVEKLPFSEATAFLEDLPVKTRCDYLSLFGPYPYYLSSIDHQLSFAGNVKRLLFDQYGPFFSLPDQLLSNSTKVQDVYNAILLAISHRKRSVKEISLYIREEEAKVSKYLSTLLQSEIVERRTAFMGSQKTAYYEIGDSLLRFYFQFVFHEQERIRYNGEIVYKENESKINDFVCHGFEDVCSLYLEELNQKGELGTVFPKTRNFRADKSKLGRSIEIDGLAEANGFLLVMECKYKNCRFDKAMLEHLKESASIFSDDLKRLYCVFSRSGFEDGVEEGDGLKLFDLERMFGRDR